MEVSMEYGRLNNKQQIIFSKHGWLKKAIMYVKQNSCNRIMYKKIALLCIT